MQKMLFLLDRIKTLKKRSQTADFLITKAKLIVLLKWEIERKVGFPPSRADLSVRALRGEKGAVSAQSPGDG
jgi:hypothetical protein